MIGLLNMRLINCSEFKFLWQLPGEAPWCYHLLAGRLRKMLHHAYHEAPRIARVPISCDLAISVLPSLYSAENVRFQLFSRAIVLGLTRLWSNTNMCRNTYCWKLSNWTEELRACLKLLLVVYQSDLSAFMCFVTNQTQSFACLQSTQAICAS